MRNFDPGPVPAQVIDKGILTADLLAHVMVAKFTDHLPLYRQEKNLGRAGLMIAHSTLAHWVGQTGMQRLCVARSGAGRRRNSRR